MSVGAILICLTKSTGKFLKTLSAEIMNLYYIISLFLYSILGPYLKFIKSQVLQKKKNKPNQTKKPKQLSSPNQINVGNTHIKKSPRINIMTIKCVCIYFSLI